MASPPSMRARAASSNCGISAECRWRKWPKRCAFRRLPSPAIGEWRKSGCAARWVPARNMQPERWSRIDEIFQAALDSAPSDRPALPHAACSGGRNARTADRPALLNAACSDDTELRREVESLLALHGNSGLTAPAIEERSEEHTSELQS